MRYSHHIPLADASDELLMELVAFGKQDALRELYDRYFNFLCRFAHGFLKDEAKAEDIVQEVFIRVMKKAGQFDSSKKFRAWILSLCANQCKNALRDENNRLRIQQSELQEPDLGSEMKHTLDQEMLKKEIAQLLQNCSEKEKQLYHLRFEMDLSLREISEVMEIAEGSVKSGLFYLIKKLRVPIKAIIHEYR